MNVGQRLEPAAPVAIRPVVAILVAIALILVGFETATRSIIERASKVQRTVNQEYREAVHITKGPLPLPKQLLIIGNSLVGHGIDFESLKQGLGPRWQVHRFWIYDTAYQDWYFGLRRLFAEGSRPDAVAVVFGAMHWCAPGIRGDYSSQYLFQTRDLRELQSRLALDRTTTSSLLFARYSKFYALRSDIRKLVLDHIIPDLPQMHSLFQPTAGKRMSDEEVRAILDTRIASYREIANSYGAKLILIVPPIPRPGEEHQSSLRMAAADAGVQIAMPMSYADVPATDFADDVHLTPAGARLYISALVKTLAPALDQSVSAPDSALRLAK
jgi:hypothetical protein